MKKSRQLRTSILSFILIIGLFISSCRCQSDKALSPVLHKEILSSAQSFQVDKNQFLQNLEYISASPHPFGSPRQTEISQWLVSKTTALGLQPTVFNFSSETPNPIVFSNPSAPADISIKKEGRNIFVLANLNPQAECLVLIGSHYDSKVVAGIQYLGANDSGSSSILMLEFLRYFEQLNLKKKPSCDLGIIWFDGEESILPNWNDGERKYPTKIKDNTYGSRAFVNQLISCKHLNQTAFCLKLGSKKLSIISFLLFDMVGSPNLFLSKDSNSSNKQIQLFQQASIELKLSENINPRPQAIEDDHIPFIKKGISALDIIDFTHLEHWHQPSDKPDTISIESINIAAKIGIFTALVNAYSPKEYIKNPDKK